MLLPDCSPEAITVGQPVPASDQARRIVDAAFDELAEQATSYKDDTPLPVIGSTPPVAQPGIPPMKARTTEIARAVMFSSLATVPPGLIAVAVMVASKDANPTVIGLICAAPAAIAVPILALARLVRSAGESAPAETHQHYYGPVTQDSRQITTRTNGVIANTRNQNG
ncbi:hypothetical protein [Streptomyces sp. NBC_00932]|uniref:hypothetical protein n=1 Tax=Streptomyces sp. NBC_00932 TaxID=2903690 RepID=UPI003865DF59|nr:hypothetical protein OG221_27765 [Streptomyces sp. NBC_00932]